MSQKLARLALGLTLVMALAGYFGCGDDNTTGPQPSSGPDWPADLGLPVEDEETLTTVADLLAELRGRLGIASARDSLLFQLQNGWPGLESARLGSDGVTITLRFEDGAEALIFTDESAFGPWEPEPSPDRSVSHWVFKGGEFAKVLECGDVIAPPSRKVHIVNLAGASNPETHGYTAYLKEYLKGLGWDENEIDVSQRESYDDCSITPETVFRQEGYGIVLFMAHGGFHWDVNGQEHFVMQTFRGGSWEEHYQDYVTEERYEEYKQWNREGKLVKAKAWCEPDSAYQPHWEVRDDLIAEQMRLDEGAMVSFLCCNSWALDDELTALGAGSVMAWDGSVSGESAMDAWWKMLAGITEQGGPKSDEETLEWMKDAGFGYHTNDWGWQSEMMLGGDDRAWHLPATLDFAAPPECLIAGTDHYEVDVRFPDCPELDASFDFFPGGEHSLPSMPPTGAEIMLRAKDAQGNTLGAGRYDMEMSPGTNPFDLCPCEGSLGLDLSDYPQDGDYAAASVQIDLGYDDPTLGGESYSMGLPLSDLDALVPGGATLDVTVFTADGDVLGTATVDENIACENPRTASFCVGWLSIDSSSFPTDATEIVVTVPGEEGAFPASLSLAPNEEGEMYGFALGSTVTLEAEAFNALGVSLGQTTASAQVSCGSNEVSVDFANYGIVMEASPYNVEPDGVSTSIITATLRSWQEGDIHEPTGDPRPNVNVAFDTNIGFFVGPAESVTDEDGEVSVELASDEYGFAVVRAFVTEDGVEPVQPAYVNFGASLEFWLDSTSRFVDGEYGYEGQTFAFWGGSGLITLNGEELYNKESCRLLGFFMCNRSASVGDTLRFVFDPMYCDPQEEDPPYIDELWLHYFWTDVYAPQITQRIHAVQDPWTSRVEVEVILEDPALR